MTFRIAHISDTHLGRDKPYFVANFLKIAEHISRTDADIIINTGDMSLDGATHEEDLVEAKRLHETIRVPTWFIPGNHDVGESQDSPNDAGLPVISDARRDRCLQHFGSDYWFMNVVGWRILGIDDQLLGSTLTAAASQIEFLREAAAAIENTRLTLFLHKPLFHMSPDEESIGGRFVNPAPRRQLLAALGNSTPALIGSGHVHQYLSEHRLGTHHVWAPSTGFILPDERQPRYGFKQVGYVEHLLESDGSHISRFVTVPGLDTLRIDDFPSAYAQYQMPEARPAPSR